jgi:hypothetical protein
MSRRTVFVATLAFCAATTNLSLWLSPQPPPVMAGAIMAYAVGYLYRAEKRLGRLRSSHTERNCK